MTNAVDVLKFTKIEFFEETNQLNVRLKLVIKSITVHNKILELIQDSVRVLYFHPFPFQFFGQLIYAKASKVLILFKNKL